MKKFLVLILLTLFSATGCVMINLPRQEPLAEKAIEGSGADKVLIIDIEGVITAQEARGSMLSRAEATITARVKEELLLAAKDEHIKAIVLRINSPGGSVTTCDIISHELKAFKKKKNIPVVAELMDVAASGGYYLAVTADKIIAHPTTVTGSIGVIAYSVNAAGLMEKIGIANQTVKTGAMKDIGSPLKTMTDDERRVIKSVIDGMYERFLEVILDGRKSLKRDELERLADGRVFSAKQALDSKLIDSIGYMEDAIDSAKQLAGIKEATVITYSQPRAYKNNIYSALQEGPAQVNLLNIDAGLFTERLGMSFMYVWMP
ncbi:MAG: signal peptide peptidase SppA [Deltaproteobacteria bacterium]